MAQLRIRGLVKAMTDIRRQLAAGIPASNAAEFRNEVRGLVAEVDRLCRKHRTTPAKLPQPTYRAYQFLQTLDLQNLPLRDETAPARPGSFRIRNLIATCNALHRELDQLAREMTADNTAAIQKAGAGLLPTIQAQVARVDRQAARAGATPADLPVRSRKAYQWLTFLCEPGNLATHLATLATAQQFHQERRAQQPSIVHRGTHFQLELYHTQVLYRTYPDKRRPRILFNEGFIGAPPQVIRALSHLTLGIGTAAEVNLIKNYANSEDFAEILQLLELTTSTAPGFTRGRHYDLAEIFETVNAQYFESQMPRPQLTWNTTLTARKFGHYHPISDTVMISITLDDPQVPPYVIEFVMYHELLHKEVGIQLVNGRRYAHTTAYKEKEKRFHSYEKARAFLDQLASG